MIFLRKIARLALSIIRILAYISLAIVVFYLLPRNAQGWIFLGIYEYFKEICYTLLVACLVFSGWWLFKGRANNTLKKRTLIVLAINLPLLVFAGYVTAYSIGNYSNCEEYSKKLNGGIKSIDGKEYEIVLCGGGHANRFNETIRLQIFSKSGTLLLMRYFGVFWDDTAPKALEYQGNRIIYHDDTSSKFEEEITMPPSVIDWIRARVPLLN